MARVRGDRRANHPVTWVVLAIVLYALLSLTVAMATVGDCGDTSADKEWQWFPPEWECKNL